MIILGYFFLFLLKHIYCGYSLEAPQNMVLSTENMIEEAYFSDNSGIIFLFL